MAFHPSREDGHELLILASHVTRLTSRRDPKSFFIERSEIAKPMNFFRGKGPGHGWCTLGPLSSVVTKGGILTTLGVA